MRGGDPGRTCLIERSHGVRLAEIVAVMSKATDLGMGQPLETAMRTCVVATRLGAALGFDVATQQVTYYLALMRYVGCTADSHRLAAAAGDELALRRDFAFIDIADQRQIGMLAGRYFAAERLPELPAMMQESFSGHCEVAQRLAGRIGMPPPLIEALGQLYERWDGRGHPQRLRGTDVARPVMAVSLAQDAALANQAGGRDHAIAVVRSRSGAAYDPVIAEGFCDSAVDILQDVDGEPRWQLVLDHEPGDRGAIDQDLLERGCAAIADFADLTSPCLLGHSHAVAHLASAAAHHAGLPAGDVTEVRLASLLHDVGRVGISSAVWGKNRALSESEWEMVRLHPYFTERVLAGSAALARLGTLGSHHHERADGSGYHRGLRGGALSPSARILAAADAYVAMTSDRPHRPALTATAAAGELADEVRAGTHDPDAVAAVLAAAGHPRRRPQLIAGLSRRELEVLRLVALSLSNREVASTLHLAPDTVKRHVQNILTKTGTATRAGATLFAAENGLLDNK